MSLCTSTFAESAPVRLKLFSRAIPSGLPLFCGDTAADWQPSVQRVDVGRGEWAIEYRREAQRHERLLGWLLQVNDKRLDTLDGNLVERGGITT